MNFFKLFHKQNTDQAWGNAKWNGNPLQCITCIQSNASNVLCHKLSITRNGNVMH